MAASDWSHSFRLVCEANLVSEAMLIVIGGHSRNVGKTSMAAAIIRSTLACPWVAVGPGPSGCVYVLTPDAFEVCLLPR
jgi:hypothetical protein